MEDIPCKTCQYYVPHYIKYFSDIITHLAEVDGQCNCPEVNHAHRGNKMKLNNPCDRWVKKQPIDTRVPICDTLYYIERHLADIRAILRDEHDS